MYKVFINVNSQNLNYPILKWAKDQNSTIFQRMVNKYMKRCSVSLMIGKMQIKTTVKHYFTPVRIVDTKKDEVTNFYKAVKKREIFCIVSGDVDWYSQYGNQYENPSKK